jgi:hypothetical protein
MDYKKYDRYKPLKTCIKKSLKPINKINKKYTNCFIKNCKDNKNNNITKSNNSIKANNTKKSNKH